MLSDAARPGTLAAILVIDSTDRARLPQARHAFQNLVAAGSDEPVLGDIAIIILANKQDVEDAMSLREVEEGLGLDGTEIGRRKWAIFVRDFILSTERNCAY